MRPALDFRHAVATFPLMEPLAPRDFPFRVAARILALALLAPAFALGHSDLHEAITALDREIAAQPASAALHLRRGELHRKHADWLKAAADYDRAAALDPALKVVDLARGALGVEARRPEAAKTALDRFVKNCPDDAAGYAARARLLRQQKEPAAAAEDFARAVACAQQPAPDLFLDYAELLREAGKPADAVAVLEAGIAKLGPLVTLAALALDLEIAQGRTDTALRRVDALVAAAPRKEAWLLRRSGILEKAGRMAEARAACEQARAALAVVPEVRRSTAAARALQDEIEAALRRLQP